MADRTRLLVIGPTPPPFHGVAVAIHTLLNSGLDQWFDVNHLDIADRRGIGHVNKPDAHDVLLFIRHMARLLGLLIRRRPHIVYFVLSQTTVGVVRDSLFVWPAVLSGAKVVAHLHGGAFQDWYASRGFLMRWYTGLLMRNITRTLVLGESLRNQFQGLVDPERVTVVPNGITDCGVGCVGMPRLRRRWQVLYLNTLNKMKGTLVLLEAITMIVQQRADVEFIFAGPWSHDDHRREAEAYIAQQRISYAITLTGQVTGEHKRDLLHSADLFVFPGIQQEGQPLVVLEAMAAGLPILYTLRGCLKETLKNGDTGIVVPAGDSSTLADRIMQLLNQPQEMARLGANARRRYEQDFTVERHLARIRAVFEDVAAAQKAPGTLKASARKARRAF